MPTLKIEECRVVLNEDYKQILLKINDFLEQKLKHLERDFENGR